MYTYIFVLFVAIGGITLVESESCNCTQPVDKIPYQNLVCGAEWVVIFKRKGNSTKVGDNFLKYKGKIETVWKPQVPPWVQNQLFKPNNNAEIFTDAACPVKLKKRKYILSGSRLFGELFISKCESLVLPYKEDGPYEENLKTNFQQNCDCQVSWEKSNCNKNNQSELLFNEENAAGRNDSCVGALQVQDCENAIVYCSKKDDVCKWVVNVSPDDESTQSVCENSVFCEAKGSNSTCTAKALYRSCKKIKKGSRKHMTKEEDNDKK